MAFARTADWEDLLVRRIVSMTSALFADVLLIAFFLGVPAATAVTTVWLLIPGVLLWFPGRKLATWGFGAFAIGSIHTATSVWFIETFSTGTRLRACAIWCFLAFIFGAACRLTVLRRGEDEAT
jgi:hypothetical protein